MSRTLSKKEFTRALAEVGIDRADLFYDSIRSLGTRENVDIHFLQKMIREIGKGNTEILFDTFSFTSAGKQLLARSDRKKENVHWKVSYSKNLFHFLHLFYPRLRKILTQPALRETPYTFKLSKFGHKGFPFQLAIVKKEEKDPLVARIDFDVHLRQGKSPSVVIGSMQGYDHAAIQEIRKITGSPVLLLLHRVFASAFTKPGQRIALNPKYHPYYKPDLHWLARSMQERGKLTAEEARSYIIYLMGREGSRKRFFEIKPTVDAEAERLRRDTTNIHRWGLSTAGFKNATNSRYVRTRAFHAIRKRRAAAKRTG